MLRILSTTACLPRDLGSVGFQISSALVLLLHDGHGGRWRGLIVKRQGSKAKQGSDTMDRAVG